MKWYRSDVVPNTDLLEHFFACEQCGHLETRECPNRASG
jgi:hypothetical protein